MDCSQPHARWQPVTQSARSRWSYGKIEDYEQSRLKKIDLTWNIYSKTYTKSFNFLFGFFHCLNPYTFCDPTRMVEQNPNTHMLHSFHPNTSSWSVFNKHHEAPLQHAVSRLTNKELGTWLVLMHLYCLPANHSSSISEIFNLHSVTLFLQIFDAFTLR